MPLNGSLSLPPPLLSLTLPLSLSYPFIPATDDELHINSKILANTFVLHTGTVSLHYETIFIQLKHHNVVAHVENF